MANIADLTAQGTESYSSAALENSASVTTVQSILYGADGRNTDSTNGIWVMVFDKATAPVNGDIPKIVIGVPAAGTTPSTLNAGNWSLGAPSVGVKFKTGIQIAASTTDAASLTLSATSKTFFHVEFARESGVDAV